MKTVSLSAFLLPVICCAICMAEAPPLRTISVTGTSVTSVAPDMVRWNITCTDENTSLESAKKENDRKLYHILNSIRELKVAPEDIQAGLASVQRVFNRDSHGNITSFRHFSVRRTVRFTQRDLERYDSFFSSLTDDTGVEVNMSFDSSRLHELRWENRLEAVRIARKKAEEMAAILGAQIKGPLTIDEHPPQQQANPWSSPYSNNIMSNGSIEIGAPAAPDRNSGSLEPGAMEIQNTVYVTFELH